MARCVSAGNGGARNARSDSPTTKQWLRRCDSIADVVLRIGDRLVENEGRRGSFTPADMRSMEAEIERVSSGNDELVLRALDDPRIVAWKQAWADQRNLAGLEAAIRVNYFDGLAMRIRQRSAEQGTRG